MKRVGVPLAIASGIGLGMFFSSRWIDRHREKGVMCQCKPRLEGKVVVITGATSGIGYQVALECAKRKARVIFGTRSLDKGLKVAGEIKALSGNEDVTALHLDLNDLKSCKAFANQVLNKESVVSFLVNNAGIYHETPRITMDGFDHTWQTNYLGSVVVTENLLGNIGVGEVGHKGVIFLSSEARKLASPKDALECLDEKVKVAPNLTTSDEKIKHYALTKQALSIYATFLAHSQGAVADCTVVSVDPGNVWTNIYKNCFRNGMYGLYKRTQCSLLMRTPLEGAQTVLHCMQAPSVPNGVCMKDCALQSKPSKAMYESCPSFVAKTHKLVSAHIPQQTDQPNQKDNVAEPPAVVDKRKGGLSLW